MSQKPIRRALEQRPAVLKRWFEKEYSAIERAVRAESLEIHWGDEATLVDAGVCGSGAGLRVADLPGSIARAGRSTYFVGRLSSRLTAMAPAITKAPTSQVIGCSSTVRTVSMISRIRFGSGS